MEAVMISLFENARKASTEVSAWDDARKVNLLRSLAARLLAETANIIVENKKDLDRMNDSDPKKDRLLLNPARIQSLADSLLDIAALPDPSGVLISETRHANGLSIQKKTVPLGVVGVIYESRPNVTVDVAALCLRSGNACILRGGTDALETNRYLVELIRGILQESGLTPDAVQLFPVDRKFIADMLSATAYIDIIIPRGSQELIEFVRKNSLVPVIETGAGVCHTYVESSARLQDAVNIVVNAKVSRPSVCNALDTVLIDRAVAGEFLTLLAPAIGAFDVEIFADGESYTLLEKAGYARLQHASDEDFGREFLDLKCSVKVVNNSQEAMAHVAQFSSRHSEAILTENSDLAEQFLNGVDAAAVYWNASTRFTDGGVFGLGAEIGISTQKLHARGPFALEKLVTEKWFIRGSGQIR